jgi:hypothetical protein
MCIILCGYKGEINALLDTMNPGLKGRFPSMCTVEFASYDESQLSAISQLKAKQKKLSVPYRVRSAMARHLTVQSKLSTFRNGGAVDLLLDKMMSCAEQRVQGERQAAPPAAAGEEVLLTSSALVMEDFEEAIREEDDKDDGVPLHPQIQG